MLPKVANHLLHHTTRAVAAVQNQTSHTIRNVLQLQSSSGPSTAGGNISGWNGASSSNSGRNGHGAGSGGAKYHTGSRTYSGYTGAGRAVTQAEAITSNDVGQGLSDDSDDVHSNSTRSGLPGRRKSFSIGAHEQRPEKLAVLKAVRSHTRSRQPFSERAAGALIESGTPLSSSGTQVILHRSTSHASAVRHESTSIASHPAGDISDPVPPSASLLSPSALAKSSRPSTSNPEILTPPFDSSETTATEKETFKAIESAVTSGTVSSVLNEVQKVRSQVETPSPALYNSVLDALLRVRSNGEPLHGILEVYNEMLARSVLPNFRTYTILISALTERDREIHRDIQIVEARVRKLSAVGAIDAATRRAEEERIAGLRSENNFRSAMTLFQTICAIPKVKIPYDIYDRLLRSCVIHANIDAAIHVYAHLERRIGLRPSAHIYRYLVQVYSNAGDIQGAAEVFEEFKAACKSGTLYTHTAEGDSEEVADASFTARAVRIAAWNAMIDAYIRAGDHAAAIGLLEQMLDTKAVEGFETADVPPPSSATFFGIIRSFCEAGDVDTALSWFDRLLQQDVHPRHRWQPSLTPSRPEYETYITLLDALVVAGRVDEVNRIFSRLSEFSTQDKLHIRSADRMTVLQANVHYLRTQDNLDEDKAISILDFLCSSVIQDKMLHVPLYRKGFATKSVARVLADFYLTYDRYDKAIGIAERYFDVQRAGIRQVETVNPSSGDEVHNRRRLVEWFATETMDKLSRSHRSKLSLKQHLRFAKYIHSVGLLLSSPLTTSCLCTYASSRSSADLQLSSDEWLTLLHCHLDRAENINKGLDLSLKSVIEDMASHAFNFGDLSLHDLRRIVRKMVSEDGSEDGFEAIKTFLLNLNESFTLALNSGGFAVSNSDTMPSAESSIADHVSQPSAAKVDSVHGNFVNEWFPNVLDPLVGYKRFEAGQRKGVYPNPEVLARLINALGRLGHVDKVYNLYQAAQLALVAYDDNKPRQSFAWQHIEDSMIVALAHAGKIDAAHVHRIRMIEHGGSPSSDAYGALIHNVKDTTDDAQNALAIFNEALHRDVPANSYLYNTIISKLAKARKADDALALFQDMKSRGISPSSVTYGALIAACCRVGDAVSAEVLFEEMSNQPNFKPRVPPYNTMMQFYTHTKPDRARVLQYYNALLAANIRPTAHTYKLLLDAYGSIEPIDIPAMERIFDQVTSGPRPLIQGTHWASIINSWGCVQKDLDRAVSTFEMIATHPSTQQSGLVLPDAVVFEALINVLVTLRRTDLLPTYVDRLASHGIHMTAYIANLLIKGYASVGDIERSREIFEGLVDPPEGMAAIYNHAPHDGAADKPPVSVGDPVYREPSTWEAMVRAELGSGNKDRALALLDRVQARKFPPAVYSRISAIMLGDDVASPWTASTYSSP